jgi:hypothetical protein
MKRRSAADARAAMTAHLSWTANITVTDANGARSKRMPGASAPAGTRRRSR